MRLALRKSRVLIKRKFCFNKLYDSGSDGFSEFLRQRICHPFKSIVDYAPSSQLLKTVGLTIIR
ncbi:hypothetical protein SAMN05720354_12411 [Nitrosospira sp. Nsp1]|nr:hypothetical protein SAMN05720354_12411 [Nitrosospira sp. Nsp1]